MMFPNNISIPECDHSVFTVEFMITIPEIHNIKNGEIGIECSKFF